LLRRVDRGRKRFDEANGQQREHSNHGGRERASGDRGGGNHEHPHRHADTTHNNDRLTKPERPRARPCQRRSARFELGELIEHSGTDAVCPHVICRGDRSGKSCDHGRTNEPDCGCRPAVGNQSDDWRNHETDGDSSQEQREGWRMKCSDRDAGRDTGAERDGRRHDHSRHEVAHSIGAHDEVVERHGARRKRPIGNTTNSESSPHALSQFSHRAEHGVVGHETFRVAQSRPSEAEEAHSDDRDQQVHDRRLFARAHNEPTGDRGEGEREETRSSTECNGGEHPPRCSAKKLGDPRNCRCDRCQCGR